MAKGLAVVSGSSDVVFKVLETGTITMGSATTAAAVTITGSVALSGSSNPLSIEGLSSAAVSDAADDILVIDSSGVVKRVEKLSASDVQLADGQTVEQFSGSVDGRLNTLETSVGTGVLVVSGSTEIENVDLSVGSIQFLGTSAETDVTVTTSSAGNVVVTVGLVPDVTVNTLTASSGLLVSAGGVNVTGDVLVDGFVSASTDLLAGGNLDVELSANVGGTLTVENGNIVASNGNISGSGTLEIGSTSTLGGTVTVTTGDIVASNGNISGSGTLQVGGNTNIGGNLTVTGDFLVEGTVTTINTDNLTVEDAIILVGSNSDASTGELGIVFGSTNGRSLSLQNGVFYLGSTSDDTLDGDIDPNNDGLGKIILGSLTASVEIKASKIESVGNLIVGGTSSLNGPVILGDAAADSVTVNGYLTSSTGIIVSSSLIVGDAGSVGTQYTKFVTQVRMPIFTPAGDALEGTFPAIPTSYISNPAGQGGHMFYLTASTNVGPGEFFPEGNKWYFNERGTWYESFFFNG